jgi:hypothetical protein
MNDVSMPRTTAHARLVALLAFPLALGCAKVASGGDGTGGNHGGGGVTGAAGGAGTGGPRGGNQGQGGGGVVPDSGTTCDMLNFEFKPKIPTVYLAADRSNSMFHCLSSGELVCPTASDTSWTKFKDAALMVVNSLQSQVRFGFTTIVGTNPMSGGTCPIPEKIAPALNNAAQIATLYNSLPFPLPADASTPGKKFETPASMILKSLGDDLSKDTTPGAKYILFVTDGQVDYCDDSLAICANDSVAYVLQSIKTMGVTTMVMGIQSTQFNLTPGVLEAWANAGAGEPTPLVLDGNLDKNALWDQCFNGRVAGWLADLAVKHPSAAEQVRGVTLGDYAPAGTPAGPTKPFKPDATIAGALATQLSAALSGVKTCTFDLKDPSITPKPIKVDTALLDKAHVDFCTSITGDVCDGPTEIPLNDTNGWRVNCVPAGAPDCTPTQIELTGSACASWRMPNNNNIHFDFPCGVIIPG